MDTMKVTSTEFQARFGQLADKALTEPVTITKNGHDRLVLISAEEYARMRRRERRVYRTGEMPQYLVDAIRQAEPPPEAAAFDSEVPEGWTGQ
jgi:prevent-host-death family protein